MSHKHGPATNEPGTSTQLKPDPEVLGTALHTKLAVQVTVPQQHNPQTSKPVLLAVAPTSFMVLQPPIGFGTRHVPNQHHTTAPDGSTRETGLPNNGNERLIPSAYPTGGVVLLLSGSLCTNRLIAGPYSLARFW